MGFVKVLDGAPSVDFQLSTVTSRQSLIPEQHAGRINQILLIAKHLNQFVGERGDFALQISCQFAIDFPPGVSRQFVAPAQRILNQTGQFRRRRSAELHRDCGIIHERVVLLPRPGFLPRGRQQRLAYNERPRHAIAEALHQRIAQCGNSSNQIGERQRIEHYGALLEGFWNGQTIGKRLLLIPFGPLRRFLLDLYSNTILVYTVYV